MVVKTWNENYVDFKFPWLKFVTQYENNVELALASLKIFGWQDSVAGFQKYYKLNCNPSLKNEIGSGEEERFVLLKLMGHPRIVDARIKLMDRTTIRLLWDDPEDRTEYKFSSMTDAKEFPLRSSLSCSSVCYESLDSTNKLPIITSGILGSTSCVLYFSLKGSHNSKRSFIARQMVL